jgi:hypothetical protein
MVAVDSLVGVGLVERLTERCFASMRGSGGRLVWRVRKQASTDRLIENR